ncbi:MAG: hypothetical protein AAFY60_19065, partial [Myxococcota bacterium]
MKPATLSFLLTLGSKLVCGLVLGACGLEDPEVFDVAIRFDGNGEPRLNNVSRFSLELYLPGTREVGCDGLALATDMLAPAIELQLQGRSNPELTTIPRTGRKLVVLRGFDENEVAVVAGCAEFGTLDSDSSITVTLEPTTRAALSLVSGDFTRWRVEVRDARGELRPEVEARWESLAAGQFNPFSEAVGPDREFTILEAPSAGPLRVSVLTRWAIEAATEVVFVPPAQDVFVVPNAPAQFG